jgi:hypothetical protein
MSEQKTLKEEAQEYVPKQTLNVADLDKVDLSWKTEDREGTDSEGNSYKYKVIVINEQEYRVPNSVIEKIQQMLDLKPDLQFVKVEKSGSGLGTKYSVKKVE